MKGTYGIRYVGQLLRLSLSLEYNDDIEVVQTRVFEADSTIGRGQVNPC